MGVDKKHLPKLPFRLKFINQTLLGDEWEGKNIENMVGAVQVPLGVAGPIELPGWGRFVVPLATTEAALVASVNRGLKVIREFGEVDYVVKYAGMTRGPIFKTSGLRQSFKVLEWAKNKGFDYLAGLAGKVSNHIRLIKVQGQVLGSYVFVRFRFDTDEAMGMNMVTYASEVLGYEIEKATGAKLVSLSGNFCADKKFSFANMMFGRGYQVWVEVRISDEGVKKVLKSQVDRLVEVYKSKVLYGTVLSGSLSFNAHVANVLAAFYLATGQDIAHVAENAHGFLVMEKEDKGLYASLFLPNVNVGSVGGGTKLPTQDEAKRMVLAGLDKGVKVKKAQVLAGVVGVACLGAELSLMAALAEGKLACSHKVLTGRGVK